MLIGELSKRTCVSVYTIRFYEKSGLIQGERNDTHKSNNYYSYSEEVVEKLELIQDAKSVGFTLKEIASLMDAWYSNGITIAEKLDVLDAKISYIDKQIQQLKRVKKLIAQFKISIVEESC